MFTPELFMMKLAASGPSWRETLSDVIEQSYVSGSHYYNGVVVNEAETRLIAASGSTLYQYSMSTAGDISTLSYDSSSYAVGNGIYNIYNVEGNADLSKLWVVGQQSRINQYSLSTAGSLSTASYDGAKVFGDTWDPVYQYWVPTVRGMWMAPDESWCLIGGTYLEARINKYTLTTPGDITTLSLQHGINVIGGEATEPRAIVCSPFEDVFWYFRYFAGAAFAYQYSLSTPGDFTTASYDNVSEVLFSSNGFDWHVTPDGNRIYTVDASYGRLYDHS